VLGEYAGYVLQPVLRIDIAGPFRPSFETSSK